jgi:hypothetical protein
MKHIEIDIHFFHEKVSIGQVCVLHVPTSLQFADIMMKGLPTNLFLDFQSSLCVQDPPALTWGGVVIVLLLALTVGLTTLLLALTIG